MLIILYKCNSCKIVLFYVIQTKSLWKNYLTESFLFMWQTPCCQKVYTCRFCHDEKEDHTMNRKEVTELICTVCETRQPVQADCRNCGVRFGKVLDSLLTVIKLVKLLF